MSEKKASPSRLPVRKSRKKGEVEVPKCETEELKTITFAMSTLFGLSFLGDINIAMSDPLTDVHPKEVNKTFTSKCEECCKICDFSIGIKDKQAKKNKRELLRHFIQGFDSKEVLHNITPANIRRFLEMCVKNISRPFPSMRKITAFDYGDMMEDTAWPHLQLVYKSMFRLFDSNLTVNLDNPTLLSVLVGNACSPDDRERQACRDVLISLHMKCESSRPLIFRFVIDQFLTTICSRELLDFFAQLVASLAVPLGHNDLLFFNECVLLLHSSHLFMRFCLSLLQVINKYIKAEPALLKPTFRYIFAHWPSATTRKQMIFLSEVEGLVVSYSSLITPEIAEMIFTQVGKLVTLPNIEVAEAALNLLLGMSFEPMIIANATVAMKVLVGPLYEAAKKHWNDFVREDAEFCLRMFNEMDATEFRARMKALALEKKTKKTYKKICRAHWEKVFETAKGNDKTIRSVNLLSLV